MSCGEMWSKICHVETFLHMINVETIFFVTIHADLSQNLLCCHLRCIGAKSILSRFTRFCGQNFFLRYCACGEKRTNMRYELTMKCFINSLNTLLKSISECLRRARGRKYLRGCNKLQDDFCLFLVVEDQESKQLHM